MPAKGLSLFAPDLAVLAGELILFAVAAYYAVLYVVGRKKEAERGLEAAAYATVLFIAAMATPWIISMALPSAGDAVQAIKEMNYTKALLIAGDTFKRAGDNAKDFLLWWQTTVAIYSYSTVLYPVGMASSTVLGIPAQVAQTVALLGYTLANLCYALVPLPPIAAVAAVLIAHGRTRALGGFVLGLTTVAPAVLAEAADHVGYFSFHAEKPPTDLPSLLAKILDVLKKIAAYVLGVVYDSAYNFAEAALIMSVAAVALAAFTAVATWMYAKAAHHLSVE